MAPSRGGQDMKIIFSVVNVRVIPKTSLQNFMRKFSKNKKHTQKWFPKYPKMTLNRDENHVKNRIVTIIVSSDANLDMPPTLRI